MSPNVEHDGAANSATPLAVEHPLESVRKHLAAGTRRPESVLEEINTHSHESNFVDLKEPVRVCPPSNHRGLLQTSLESDLDIDKTKPTSNVPRIRWSPKNCLRHPLL